MPSKTLHVVSTTVTNDVDDAEYRGAAWGVLPDPSGRDLSPDADGVYIDENAIVVDLSHMLSRTLGKQMPMTGTYRIKGIKIGLKNVDDLIDDNDRGMLAYGYIYTHGETKHKIDALQAARFVERHSEIGQTDGDSEIFVSDAGSPHYRGMRYGWNGANQVAHQTQCSVSDYNTVSGSTTWNMVDLFDIYENGLDQPDEKDNALWTQRTGGPNLMRFSCDIQNAMHSESGFLDDGGLIPDVAVIESPRVNDFHWQAPGDTHIDALCGLVLIDVLGSNTLPNGDMSPDDYDWHVTFEIEGWSTW